MSLKQGSISPLSGEPLKLVAQLTYISSNISSTESDVNLDIAKVNCYCLVIKEKSDKIKKDFC